MRVHTGSAALDFHGHEIYRETIEKTACLEKGRNFDDAHYGKMGNRHRHTMHKDSEDYCAQCHGWGVDGSVGDLMSSGDE